MEVTALLSLGAVALTGLVSPVQALSGFSNPAVVTVWAVFILSGGLTLTGVANVIGRFVLRLAGTSESRMIIVIMVTAGVMSAIMNNVAVAALMLPVVMDIARHTDRPPSRLLMPLAYGSLLGGLTTQIGTPPNILVSDALRDAGMKTFTFFDFTPVGLIIMFAGVAFMVLIGRHLLPQRDVAKESSTSKSNDFVTTTSVREAFAISRGIVRGQPLLTFWAGQRFYDRHDVHIVDYFYRDMSGFGGGFEDLVLGNSFKLSLAYLGGSIDQLTSNGNVQPSNQFLLNKTTLDLTIYDITLGSGTLGFTFDVSNFRGDSAVLEDDTYYVSSDVGWSAGLFYKIPFKGGRNLVSLFYGNGAAENYKAVISQPMGITPVPGEEIDVGGFRRFRVINDLLLDLSPSFSLQGLLNYQQLQNNQAEGNILNWFSAGIRPSYHFSRYFSLVGELGMDYTEQESMESGVLFKATIAPQISPLNKIMSRPALRAFLSYATWSDSFIGQVATASYADQDHGISIGLQMEVWW